jgi:hypothetical protein
VEGMIQGLLGFVDREEIGKLQTKFKERTLGLALSEWVSY